MEDIIMVVARGTEPYAGDIMRQCFIRPFDFKHAFVVVVSGASWNPCGHTLLNTGSDNGWYFHIAERKGCPRFMRRQGYQRYLQEHQKRELRRTFVAVPNPEGAHFKLEELLAKQWSWFVLPNNCASFVEDVVQAGGSKAGLYLNCPSRERFK
ncbi:hypothetical protein [Janthinobacterium fluminis]|uniref:DUF4105 domain-containing protein n=1 Tax=Janthinobacterium fluminis TaxID=2987524 RepID=A0ABT5K6P0_9BURK|nr:hypothetical protein [Janthinobacterium fluminis]MDC8760670.1 hypothetical protein [Janthinobacterium fluminis]